MHFGTITTLLACTARSTVPRQRNAPVQNPLLLLRLINTLGSSIAVGCFRHRSPPDCEFAPHNLLLTTLELTAATAQLQGATLQYSAVPGAYPPLDPFDFRADAMRPLLRYAEECAQAGRLWTAFERSNDDS